MSQKKYASLSTLQTFLDNLKTTFSHLGHKHTISDVTDYVVDDALSSTSVNPVQNKVLNTEFDGISHAMQALELALDDKEDSITGTEGQVVQIDSNGNAVASDLNLITVEDIDAICGETINSANEVMF